MREPTGVDAIGDWTTGYVRRHPLASLTTVGEQFVLGLRTIQYLFVDLVTGRFQWQEFRQAASLTAAILMAAVGSAITADLGTGLRRWAVLPHPALVSL